MTVLDDLTNALSTLEANATAVVGKVNDLKAAAGNAVDPAAVAAATQRINTVATQLSTAAQ